MGEPQDAITAAIPVLDALKALGVEHHVGGSIASSVYGIGRTTLDADLIADLHPGKVAAFVDALAADYYIDRTSVEEAIQQRDSFNVIHLGTMIKVDVFIQKTDPFNSSVAQRVQMQMLDEERGIGPCPVASAEDVVLHKLRWCVLGDAVSDRQWTDIVNVLKVQRNTLDRSYLDKWANELDVGEFLVKAWNESEALGA